MTRACASQKYSLFQQIIHPAECPSNIFFPGEGGLQARTDADVAECIYGKVPQLGIIGLHLSIEEFSDPKKLKNHLRGEECADEGWVWGEGKVILCNTSAVEMI